MQPERGFEPLPVGFDYFSQMSPRQYVSFFHKNILNLNSDNMNIQFLKAGHVREYVAGNSMRERRGWVANLQIMESSTGKNSRVVDLFFKIRHDNLCDVGELRVLKLLPMLQLIFIPSHPPSFPSQINEYELLLPNASIILSICTLSCKYQT